MATYHHGDLRAAMLAAAARLVEDEGVAGLSVREAARRAERDVKAVHGDVHALLAAGVLRKTADGRIEFPFDAVHVDFVLRAA